MYPNAANVRAARVAIHRAVVVEAEAAQIRVAANGAMAATVVAEGNQAAAANNSHRPTHNKKSHNNTNPQSRVNHAILRIFRAIFIQFWQEKNTK